MCSSTFGAGNPPARICEGESRMAELLARAPYDEFSRVLTESRLGAPLVSCG